LGFLFQQEDIRQSELVRTKPRAAEGRYRWASELLPSEPDARDAEQK
jgi:hypothetical protein